MDRQTDGMLGRTRDDDDDADDGGGDDVFSVYVCLFYLCFIF